MRKPLIAANWKMNMNMAEAETFIERITHVEDLMEAADILIIPPYTLLYAMHLRLAGKKAYLGGQNCYYEKHGAYTGEISAEMLIDCGCSYVLVGHSERRNLFAENNDIVARKIKISFEAGLSPILCIGETLEARNNKAYKNVISDQLRTALASLTEPSFENVEFSVAYEPVWAIGTGMAASPTDVEEVASSIREVINECIGLEKAMRVRILYGGSVTPGNISIFSKCNDIDGVLIGGASLRADSYLQICSNFLNNR